MDEYQYSDESSSSANQVIQPLLIQHNTTDLVCDTSINDQAGVSQQSQTSQSLSSRKFVVQSGEIGYMKGDSFVAVSNFTVECTGYVSKDATSTTAEGYFIDVIPKPSVQAIDLENDSSPNTTTEKR